MHDACVFEAVKCTQDAFLRKPQDAAERLVIHRPAGGRESNGYAALITRRDLVDRWRLHRFYVAGWFVRAETHREGRLAKPRDYVVDERASSSRRRRTTVLRSPNGFDAIFECLDGPGVGGLHVVVELYRKRLLGGCGGQGVAQIRSPIGTAYGEVAPLDRKRSGFDKLAHKYVKRHRIDGAHRFRASNERRANGKHPALNRSQHIRGDTARIAQQRYSGARGVRDPLGHAVERIAVER